MHHRVKELFHDMFFPDNTEGDKHMPRTHMGNWLYIEQKCMLKWPSGISLIPFNLNKLSVEKLKLLCKADAEIVQWTEEEQEHVKKGNIVLISSGSGLMLFRVCDNPEYQPCTAKTKQKSSKKSAKVVDAETGDLNAQMSTNLRISPLPSLPPSPSLPHIQWRNSTAGIGSSEPYMEAHGDNKSSGKGNCGSSLHYDTAASSQVAMTVTPFNENIVSKSKQGAAAVMKKRSKRLWSSED
ncbi:hypothetical protein K439DRAFT_1623695 [Ramaria rubella]|nr:hypothetical protein K439DRAFT_1623695 [Ramaria rubella]